MKNRLVLLGVCLVLCTTGVGCACQEEVASPVPTTAPEATAIPPADTPVPTVEAAAEESPTAPSELAWMADGAIGKGEYRHTTEAAGVTFHWTNDAEYLYAALSAETIGWVSVGFNPENRMQGANYIYGYVADSTAFVEDMFGVSPAGPGSHPADEGLGGGNDVVEYAGSEQGGVTVIEFKIPLDSGDEYDKSLVPGETYRIVLAVGAADDLDSYHTGRGTSEITLD